MALTLIVPGMGRELAQAGPPWDLPQLAQLAARGSVRYAWDRSDLLHATHCAWQRGLLAALELAPAAHPSAALSVLAPRAGEGSIADADRTLRAGLAADTDGGEWLHLERVHLAAGLNHLSLVELGSQLQPTVEQCAALEALLQQHLQACGAAFASLPGARWFLRLPAGWQVRTVCPEAAAANELEQALPGGESGAALRRLMTELQMLLHQHPVNQQRSAQGLPEANALWPWGNGRLARTAPRRLPAAFGTHEFLLGIYRYHGAAVGPLPGSGGELLAALKDCAQAVVVLEPRAPAQFEQEWLIPLIRGLRMRRLARLELVLDGWHLSIDRRGLRRFWRRPLPPGSWVAASSERSIHS